MTPVMGQVTEGGITLGLEVRDESILTSKHAHAICLYRDDRRRGVREVVSRFRNVPPPNLRAMLERLAESGDHERCVRGLHDRGKSANEEELVVIRVCLVDDQAMIRSGLKALLQLLGGIEVVAEAADGEEAIAAVLECTPDVLLLDVRMPKVNGVEVVEALARKGKLPPTLLLTTFEDDSALIRGVKAGARGYLLKGATPETLLEAIRSVAAGGTYLYAPLVPHLARGGLKESYRDETYGALEPLTERELEILRLMASGIGNREIAQALDLREGTVKNHVSSIFSKLNVADRTKAVLRAIAAGLV